MRDDEEKESSIVPGEQFNFDARRLRPERLAACLRHCTPGSETHVALLREQARRRELQQKIEAYAPGAVDPWETADA